MTTMNLSRSGGVVSFAFGLTVALANLLVGALAHAQPGPPPPFDAAARRTAVENAAAAL
jgi:hypothetical protein